MNLKLLIQNFFEENDFGKISAHLSVVRSDGIVIYSNEGDALISNSMGALASGLWQAANSMINYVGDSDDMDYRLSFDTSSSGVFVLPLELNNTRCYLVSVYQDALNPAKLKQQLKNLMFLLEMYIRDETISVSKDSNKIIGNETREGYLFKDITDEEIDKLFGFSRV
tara:strand:- start:150806 stop:151309 length:504 start_codon:yes stop_codon:yes gene_type:complete